MCANGLQIGDVADLELQNFKFMKNYIPILGMFLAEYPIRKHFWFFFIYQVSMCGIITYLISYFFLIYLNCL
jgi:hypothetical protein